VKKSCFFVFFTVFENPQKVVFLTFFGVSGAKIVGILHQKKGRKKHVKIDRLPPYPAKKCYFLHFFEFFEKIYKKIKFIKKIKKIYKNLYI